MRTFFVALALLLYPLTQSNTVAQGGAAGDPAAGKALWDGNATSCKNCHGAAAEGGFGPDLAGRKLSLARVTRAVRQPWGIMPMFKDTQLGYTDKGLADFVAYFDSLPAPAQPGKPRYELPAAGATPGQVAVIATVGCAQCHTPTMDTPRRGGGEVNGDFEWFKRMVYDHTTTIAAQWTELGTPTAGRAVRMGNYSPIRLPETTLRVIYDYMRDEGFPLTVTARLDPGVPAADNGVTYTVVVENAGVPGKGLTAEDVTLSIPIPADLKVVSATGAGYQKVQRDEIAKADAALWKIAKLPPKSPQTFTITLSKAPADPLKGSLRWAKPTMKDAQANVVNFVPARPAGAGRGAAAGTP
jgi:mono/diheme cytochrome c family protein